MNAQDIFKQLTCGIDFSATKNIRKRPNPSASLIKPNDIKKEKLETDSSASNDGDDSDWNQHQEPEVKQESGDEHREKNDDQSLTIFGNIVASNLTKKKKKKMTDEKRKMLEIERINQIRNKHHIHTTGKNPPPPLETFKELQQQYEISPQVIDNLSDCGYSLPTPIQMQAIPIMASGQSIMACAPTGSGKTAAFLVPIIRDLRKPKQKGFRALVLCPTRELAKQTQRECLRLVEEIGLRVHTLSKINKAENRYGLKSNKKFDILVTTPNRICYLLSQDPPVLDFSKVKWLILDEADKLFEEGTKSFRDQFNQIHGACSNVALKVGLFSATWTNPVVKWCRKMLKGKLMTVSVGQRNAATDLVDQELLFAGSEQGKMLAFRELLRTGMQPPVLVFVDSKDRAQQLYKELIYDGINVDIIHADRTQQERDNVVKAFREGKIWVLICTELISRGIDFKGVNLVINYDFPPSAISYIHRIGRTGRAGRRGKAITYFTQSDTIHLKSIAKVMKNSGCPVPKYMLTMKEHSKQAKKKLLRTAAKREDISTKSKFNGKSKKEKFKKSSGVLSKKNKPMTAENGKMKKYKKKKPTAVQASSSKATPANFVMSPKKRKADNANVLPKKKKSM